MKVICIIALLVLLGGMGLAQTPYIFSTDSSYASGDTTGWVSISTGRSYTISFAFTEDTVNVSPYIDYAGSSTSIWNTATLVSGDSTQIKGSHAYFLGVVLRSPAVDLIPGAERIRLRILTRTTSQGTGTKTYTAKLWRD